jgi:hypothetical protein
MKASNHPDWALAHKKPGTELRLIRGLDSAGQTHLQGIRHVGFGYFCI